MKEIQQLRRIAVKLGVSGTVTSIAETRLYKGGYGFVVLQAYIPITQNRSPDTSPLCTVFRTTIDKFGNRKQFNKDVYNMIYTTDAEIENAKYMVFECPLPKAFTDTVGELEMVFTYSEIKAEDKGEDKVEYKEVARLASGIYRTEIADSDVSDGQIVNPLDGMWAQLNDLPAKVEQMKDSVDALLQEPDNTDANIVGTPNVTLTDDGRLKFNQLKGAKGDTGELKVGSVKQVGYDEPLKIENSGTASDAVFDFEIPQGRPVFVKVGNVVTLPPTSNARVVNVGTDTDPIFDFYIPEGVGFTIDKTYESIEAMNENYATDDVRLYGFVIIDTGNVNDDDNAKLYIKTSERYEFLTDLSGAQGIKGDKGIQGEKGEQGVGIQSIEYYRQDSNGGNVYRITLTNGQTVDFTAPKGDKGLSGDSGANVPITYAALKTLKDESRLVKGVFYRITDFVTTTAQEETQSADWPFDIIVMATDTDKLSEIAYATQHDGDTYFAQAKLNAWKLKYCFENDADRFAWADVNYGKGVIYELEDEFNNKCGYDFKNIMFKRYLVENCDDCPSLVGRYYGLKQVGQDVYLPTMSEISTAAESWRFTFSLGEESDYSMTDCRGSSKVCFGNQVNNYKIDAKSYLPNVVFLNNTTDSFCYGNILFSENTHSITIGGNCRLNSFGGNCYANVFGDDFSTNIFGNGCFNNIFGNNCYDNVVGNNCYDNIIKDMFSMNIVGNYFSSNTIGSGAQSNAFGNGCSENYCEDNCSNNTFSHWCYCNYMGNNIQYNTFDSFCSSNTLGDDCTYNTFGKSCSGNTLRGNCSFNTFGCNCYSNVFGKNSNYNDCVFIHNRTFDANTSNIRPWLL